MKKSPYIAGVIIGLYFTFSSLLAEESATLLVWGDSLSAAYGMPTDQGWVSLLKKRVNGDGYRVINGSLSGETTAGGLTRLPGMLKQHKPTIVIIELGANDGLRGISVQEMEKNLLQMTGLSHASGARVLLLGMQLPPNYGPVYSRQFQQAFEKVANATQATLLPFFLDKVATDFDLMQADGIHPIAEAQPIMLDNVWPLLQPML